MTEETPPPTAPTQKAVLSDLEIEPEAAQPETHVEKRLHRLADLLDRQIITQAEHDDAEANIRELFDLCRRCGCTSHFATKCKATFDRNGKTIY